MAKSMCGTCGECARCKRAEYMREWYRRPGNAEAQRQSQTASRWRRIEEVRAYDRERGHRVYDVTHERARMKAWKAIQRGELTRHPCEVCGSEMVEAHHPDYEKPFDVRWMCRKHHMELHRKVA